MNVQDLKAAAAKAAEKVEKIKGTIARHEKLLVKKIAAGEKWEVEYKQEEIKGAQKKLKEAELTLGNWIQKLNKAEEKELFLETNSPQVIKDFLEQWKAGAFEWYLKRYEDFKVYKAELNTKQAAAKAEYAELNPDHIPNSMSRKLDNFLQEKGLDWRTVDKKEKSFAGATVLKMCDFYRDVEGMKAWLDKDLEAEKQAKMLDLIGRINAVIGTITDAAGLRIGMKGTIDGIIIGTEGKAKIETIDAGGHWGGVQCYHFRTLVHKI